MRSAAVRLVLEDTNATGLPQAFKRRVLRERMRRHVASRWLDRRVETMAAAINQVGGARYVQPWTHAITVGRWEGEDAEERPATVAFLGYETISTGGPRRHLPMELFSVRMVRERGRWRLVTYDKSWLTPEGPTDVGGDVTIASLPERVVFRNPRPGG